MIMCGCEICITQRGYTDNINIWRSRKLHLLETECKKAEQELLKATDSPLAKSITSYIKKFQDKANNTKKELESFKAFAFPNNKKGMKKHLMLLKK